MPSITREVRLATTPRGLPVPGDLTIVDTPLPGALVTHPLGWREHALVPVDQCTPIDPGFPDPVPPPPKFPGRAGKARR